MGFVIRETVNINDKFKTLIQSGNYEKIIHAIMNDSTKVFPNNYIHILSQSKGECDIKDSLSGKKFDAKLPITTLQGKLVGSRNADLLQFFQTVRIELEEFGEYIEKRGQTDFEQLRLYQILKKKLEADKPDENLIFLFPFPVVLDLGSTSITRIAGDVLTEIYRNLKKNNIIGKREIYVIYPCVDKQIVLRCLNNNKREYIEDIYLREYIQYDIELVKE